MSWGYDSMSEKPVVYVGENSPEQIAYKLMGHIAEVEKKVFRTAELGNSTVAGRKWILDTYSECLAAAKGLR